MRHWSHVSTVLLAITALLLLGASVGCEDKKEEGDKAEPTATTTEPEASPTEEPPGDAAPTEEANADEAAPPGEAGAGATVTRAVAVIHGTEGNDGVGGTLTFEMGDGGVVIAGNITGLTPGEHGFHVHEFGDCSSPDGTAAGGHFNPTSVEHGAPDDAKKHVGDMGNITAGEDGTAAVNVTFDWLTMSGDTSIIGRGLIVHAGADDLKSQPSGDAGARVGCAVIGIAQ